MALSVKKLLTASCVLSLVLLPIPANAQLTSRDSTVAVPAHLLSGGEGEGIRGWARGVVGSARQDTRDGISGYDSRSAGFATGFDTALKDCPAIVGASISYVDSRISAKDVNTTRTDVGSYQLAVYGDYGLGRDLFIRGALGYTRADNDSARHNAGGAGITAFGDYGANQYDAFAKLMRYLQWGPATVAPNLMGRFIHYDPQSYSETGAGAANLHTDQASMNVAEVGAGMDVTLVFDADDQSGDGFSPGFHAGLGYDLAGDRIETDATPVGGGAVTTTFGPSIARTRLNSGVSMVWFTGGGWDLKAAYDVDVKQDYFAHAGTLRATGRF
jgi:outer membrane autotransporter protein